MQRLKNALEISNGDVLDAINIIRRKVTKMIMNSENKMKLINLKLLMNLKLG